MADIETKGKALEKRKSEVDDSINQIRQDLAAQKVSLAGSIKIYRNLKDFKLKGHIFYVDSPQETCACFAMVCRSNNET